MAQLEGVSIEKLQGGLQRLAEGTDNHLAYIVVGVPAGDVSTAIANNGKGIVLTSLFEAEQLGINESFDANNDLKLHFQIDEFFRLAPDATLYLFNSDASADLKKFINSNKEIKGYGLNVKYNVEVPNLTTEINKHQNLINEFALQNRFIDFALLGFDELNVFTTNLFELEAPNISVIIGCNDINKKVAIGTALGSIAVRTISENIGSVDIENKPRNKRGTQDYTLTDSILGKWTKAFLTDGREIDAIDDSVLKGITDKGYITIVGYEGYAGYFFDNSYTCIDRASDFAFIENNRTWNKSARIIRATLLPRVKSKVKKNPTTGFIASTTTSYWKTLLEKALNKMVSDNEISGFDVSIDEKQIVNNTSPVKVKALIVADGIVHEFEVALGLTNNI